MYSVEELTELGTISDFTPGPWCSWWTQTHWCPIHTTGASVTRPSIQTLQILRALNYKISYNMVSQWPQNESAKGTFFSSLIT